MKKTVAILDERLSQRGSSVHLTGHVDEDSYVLGAHHFVLPQGVEYSLDLTNAGQGIFVTGILSCTVEGTCDRCLDKAAFTLEGEVDQYYLFEEPEQTPLSSDEDELDFELVSADNTLDLTHALESVLLMETPYVILCSDECKGLCSECGCNLNHTQCSCAERLAHNASEEPQSHNAQELAKLKKLLSSSDLK